MDPELCKLNAPSMSKLIVKEDNGAPQDGTNEIEEDLGKTHDGEMPQKCDEAIGGPPSDDLQVLSERKTGGSPNEDVPIQMRDEGEFKGQMFASTSKGLECRKKLLRPAKIVRPKIKLEPQKKRKRQDYTILRNELLKMFAEKRALSFTQMQSRLKQPNRYLYQVLHSVADYHERFHVWMLKPKSDMSFDLTEMNDTEMNDMLTEDLKTESAQKTETQ